MAFCVFVDTKVHRTIAAKHQGVSGFEKIREALKERGNPYVL